MDIWRWMVGVGVTSLALAVWIAVRDYRVRGDRAGLSTIAEHFVGLLVFVAALMLIGFALTLPPPWKFIFAGLFVALGTGFAMAAMAQIMVETGRERGFQAYASYLAAALGAGVLYWFCTLQASDVLEAGSPGVRPIAYLAGVMLAPLFLRWTIRECVE